MGRNWIDQSIEATIEERAKNPAGTVINVSSSIENHLYNYYSSFLAENGVFRSWRGREKKRRSLAR